MMASGRVPSAWVVHRPLDAGNPRECRCQDLRGVRGVSGFVDASGFGAGDALGGAAAFPCSGLVDWSPIPGMLA